MTRDEAVKVLSGCVVEIVREALPPVAYNAQNEDCLVTDDVHHALGVAIAMGAAMAILLTARDKYAGTQAQAEWSAMSVLDLARSGMFRDPAFRDALHAAIRPRKAKRGVGT